MHAGPAPIRDLVGITHQRIAAMADEVVLLVAGLPVTAQGRAGMTRDDAARPSGRRGSRVDLAALDRDRAPLDDAAMAGGRGPASTA